MADKLERLINLLAVLLDTPRPLSLDEIVARVPGYPPDHESARRQFERDKEELRDSGVPVTLERDPWGEVAGYRIDRREYELPELDLSPEERAALHAAVTAVRLEGGEGREALWKLGGLDGEEAPMLGAIPSLPHLADLMDASRRRARVTFTYRDRKRTIEPYAVGFRRGHWYVHARDPEDDVVKSFRVDRVQGKVEFGEDGDFDRPATFDPDAQLRDEPWKFGDEPPVEALVWVDATASTWVVRRLGADSVVREQDGGTVVRFAVTNREAFRSFVLGLLDRAEVLEPADLRDDLTSWLRAIVAVPEGTP